MKKFSPLIILAISVILTSLPIDIDYQAELYVILGTINASLIAFLFIYAIKKLLNTQKGTNISWGNFLLISIIAVYQPIHFYAVNLFEVGLLLGICLCLFVYASFWVFYLITNLILKN